ncbi:hypothetical protein EJ377_15090 [Chryseobacterium arthrosphaerae]|uniref:Uncharacterized protein n=1 Tax=Chryseobacterium arthrosphaerae TaxID=651561 RepID=A0A3S0QSP1_9FLAO|nr:hypothetical protein EJ377_15090 [Chryseobacterium arthrosphaerae]
MSYDSLVMPDKNILYYGSAVSLDDLHQYFINVDKTPIRMLMSLLKKESVLPIRKEIPGKNITEFTDIKPKDTLCSRSRQGIHREPQFPNIWG